MRAAILLALIATACSRKPGERVYVSDEDGGQVVVIDAGRDQVIARVPVGKRPRGLRVSADGKWLYVALSGSPKAPPNADPSRIPPADRGADGIGVIDLGRLALARMIRGGQDPETFDVSADGRWLWVSNEETAEASRVDLASGEVVKRVPVGDEPEGVAFHPGGKAVYVTSEAEASVSVLDALSGAPLARIAACARPRAIAFTPDGARGFVSCENGAAIALIDAEHHARAGELKLPGDRVRPMGMAMAADGKTLYVSGGRGKTVSVIALDGTLRVAGTIADAGARPWGIALSRDGTKLYTANGPSGDVSVIDTRRGAVARRIAVGGSPWGIAIR